MTLKIPANLDPLNEDDVTFQVWLETNWERCKPFIQAALDRADGGADLDYVWSVIMNGQAQFWPGEHSAVLTKIENYPTGLKSVFCWLAGGTDLQELADIEARIAAWGKEQMGCSRIEIIGRRGWGRVLKGFRETGTILVKDI